MTVERRAALAIKVTKNEGLSDKKMLDALNMENIREKQVTYACVPENFANGTRRIEGDASEFKQEEFAY